MNVERPDQSPLHTKSGQFQKVKFVILIVTIFTVRPWNKVKVMAYFDLYGLSLIWYSGNFVESDYMDNLQISNNIIETKEMNECTLN